MKLSHNQQAFFALVKAGLWGKEARLSPSDIIDYSEVYRIAEEQSVVGLVAAGLEHITHVRAPKEKVLQFVGQALQLEQQNQAMNHFIGVLINKLREAGIYTLLVKGQGIAQCYEKPLWRSCGDVDLFLDEKNYQKAQKLLALIARDAEAENPADLHYEMTIDRWCVELHGTLRSKLGTRIDKEIDAIQNDTFKNKRIRTWQDGNTEVYLPALDNDVVFVFTHILKHFFHGGIGLRQVCDWCRLLWTYRDEIDVRLLESRLQKMGLMPHWKAFAALAVDTLGMPVEAMPLYSSEKKWIRKAEKILRLILESGNFGHGRDTSYKKKYPKLIEYLISFWVYSKYSFLQFQIFPEEALRGWGRTISIGIKAKLTDK